MNVLITGGAGFIGSHTCHLLVAAGHRVRVLDCLDPQVHGADPDFSDFLPPAIERVRGDVCSLDDCLKALEGIDSVLHLAARTGVGQSMYDISDYVETNVRGTATVIEAVVKSKISLRRFVLASSRAVYGEGLYSCKTHGICHPSVRHRSVLDRGEFEMTCPRCGTAVAALPTPETCERQPISAYALTKQHQEDYCNWAARTFEFPLVILRYFNVFGSHQSLTNPYTGVVSIFYSLLKAGRPLSLYEGGRPIRDFVHVSDVARANVLALSGDESCCGTFNIGSGNASSIADVALALASALGIEPVLEDRGEFRVGDIFACFADLSRSERELGYVPQVSMKAGMEEFVNWAEGEQSADEYDRTLTELARYGLFGQSRTGRGSR